MAESFHDHFSRVSSAYAAFRPRYPQVLFERLAALAPEPASAWDCGTGSGQAALGLAHYFEQVWATDASAAQLASAEPHPRVHYRVARAEQSGLLPGSVDLVTVAQALHWFDRPRFYDEVRRVLRPGGVLAAWCYDLMDIEPSIDAYVHDFYTRIVGPYWPPERSLVEARYATLEFPFERIDMPPVLMEAHLTLDALGGYMRTWSAVGRYREAHGNDPVTSLLEELLPLWGEPQTERSVRWPLTVRAGRV
ncbi:MAG TPA: class I SAM-dependent methyltransferase [Candidatus Eisenbacteria bacterium]|nr:class I SAM-dependent methyltransferase [Candidatus Eisenbacteria bacterium]